jgi:uncharacterized membrane protein
MRHRTNLAGWERAASIAAGAGLLAVAVSRRRYFGSLGVTGISLIARGAAGYCPVSAVTGMSSRRADTRSALGGARGTKIEESITIARPPREVFTLWSNPDELPRFMQHLERVESLDDRRSRWIMRGPGGVRVQWEAEIINWVERTSSAQAPSGSSQPWMAALRSRCRRSTTRPGGRPAHSRAGLWVEDPRPHCARTCGA